jgi:RimJ/RimL family protein N-acetyltransferase
VLEGRTCRLEPLDADRHAADLHAAYGTAPGDRLWTYMPTGPFADAGAYRAWVQGVAHRPDPFFLAVVDRTTGGATGVASYLRITPEHGTVEVGFITFSPLLQRTIAATEAMALMMGHAFDDLGYRRYEWKCDALNAPSRRAAERLGFRFEGVHRQAVVVKGRNRDTAWFSILDSEWPTVRAALDAWLAAGELRPRRASALPTRDRPVAAGQRAGSAGTCWVMQCTPPPPWASVVPGTGTTSRPGHSEPSSASASASVSAPPTGTMTAPLHR